MYLHDANPDFDIVGKATVVQTDNVLDPRCSKVTFNVSFIWNDRLDPNHKYESDTIKSVLGQIFSLGNATDYDIKIEWSGQPSVEWGWEKDAPPIVKGWPFSK